MAWTDEPTPKQIGAIAYMIGNFRFPRFTQDEKDQLLEQIKTRKDASEAMKDIRNARIAEGHDSGSGNKDGKWYKMLLELSNERRTQQRIEQLEKSLREHPNSACAGLWMRELNLLKEEEHAERV